MGSKPTNRMSTRSLKGPLELDASTCWLLQGISKMLRRPLFSVRSPHTSTQQSVSIHVGPQNPSSWLQALTSTSRTSKSFLTRLNPNLWLLDNVDWTTIDFTTHRRNSNLLCSHITFHWPKSTNCRCTCTIGTPATTSIILWRRIANVSVPGLSTLLQEPWMSSSRSWSWTYTSESMAAVWRQAKTWKYWSISHSIELCWRLIHLIVRFEILTVLLDWSKPNF